MQPDAIVCKPLRQTELSKVRIITGKERRPIIGSCNFQDKNLQLSPGNTDAILILNYTVHFPVKLQVFDGEVHMGTFQNCTNC